MTNRAAWHRTRHIGKSVASRGKNHISFDNGDGSKTTIITGAPLHKGVGPYSVLDEIDTAWQVDAGAWQYKYDSSDFLVNARDTFNVGNLFQFTDPISGEWVQFDPQSLNWIDETTSRQQIAIKQAVTAIPNDYRLQFPNAWGSGRHFQYEAHVTRLAKLITIDSAGDLPSVTLGGNQIWLEAEFSLATSSGVDVYIDGVLWQKTNGVRVQTSNRIEFRDSATGQQILWVLDFPRAWDSYGEQTIGQMECRRQGGPSSLFITLRIPKVWIDTAVFPVYLDPTTVYSDASGDGEVGHTSSSTWSGCHDATSGDYADTTFTGSSTYSRRKGAGGGTYEIVRGFLPFNTASIPDGDTISAATLNYKANNTYDEVDDAYSYMVIVEGQQASSTALVVADYDNCGDAVTNPTEGHDTGQRKDITGISTSNYTVFTLNSTGIGWINKTGYSKFGTREGHDTTNTEVTGNNRSGISWASADTSGTTSDPYLEITHSSPSDDLTANSISTTPVVGQPTIGQTHVLSATGINTTPVVGQPTIGQTHALDANGITTTPAVGQPTIGQTHILDANGISTTPVVDTPTIGQIHALTANGINTTPVVGQPTIGQTHVLDANGISTTPVVGQPTLGTGGEDNLTANSISTTPEVDTPSIGQTHVLDANGISTTPVVGQPTIGQTHVLDANGISTTPVVGQSTIGQTHVLDANGISTTPVVGNPVLGGPDTDNLVAEDINTGVPVVGQPTIGQTHVLDATGITITPVVGQPVLGHIYVLDATGISTTPAVDNPQIGQIHALLSSGISTTPVVGTPTLGQIHSLDANDITTTPVVGSPAFDPIKGVIIVLFDAIKPEIEFKVIYPEIEFSSLSED